MPTRKKQMKRGATAARKKNKNATTVMQQKRKASKTLKKAAQTANVRSKNAKFIGKLKGIGESESSHKKSKLRGSKKYVSEKLKSTRLSNRAKQLKKSARSPKGKK